jgi:hypothetical protein
VPNCASRSRCSLDVNIGPCPLTRRGPSKFSQRLVSVAWTTGFSGGRSAANLAMRRFQRASITGVRPSTIKLSFPHSRPQKGIGSHHLRCFLPERCRRRGH